MSLKGALDLGRVSQVAPEYRRLRQILARQAGERAASGVA
jgi:hypothetical protein